ncbi:MAG: FHA domain-containing protein [Lachnospiraceae bacterium]|nr:FHA domain-containing protein [Lachnospiraceae bacterium]
MEMCYVSKGINNYIQVSTANGLIEKNSPVAYRLKMLENNDIEGLIRPIAIELDGELTLKYNTNSYYVLDRLFLKFKPDGSFLGIIMGQLERVLNRLREFLLEPDDLVIKPEYMFYNWGEKALKLIYIPGYGKNIKEQLKSFLEYVMRIFDHRDESGVRYMYGMYDLICEDTFSIWDFGYRLEGSEGDTDYGQSADYGGRASDGNKTSVQEKEITKLVPLTSGALKEIVISKYDEMILVGRGKRETDYRIPTTQISRVHACIYIRSNGLYVEDRESTNGTFINSVRLEPLKQERIVVGDLINFANEEFFAV